MLSYFRSALVVVVVSIGWSAWADPDDLNPALDGQYLPEYGSSALWWQGRQQLAGFRNTWKVVPARRVEAGEFVLELPRAEVDLGNVPVSSGDSVLSVNDYIDRQRVAGLLVIKDGVIRYERYALGNDEKSRWVSFSVAKSVVSMLFGAALADGYIDSVDEKVTDYLPRLKGSSYEQTTIRNLLQMASGVAWNEDYADPESDVATASWETMELYGFLRHKPRAAPPGEKFNYNTAETNLAGTLLRAAIGNNLSTYLSDKIWKPFGMEADAYWQLTEPGGGEFGGCCISATLRDYGRLGLFALSGGVLADGTRVLPDGWMSASTAPSAGFDGYGYFWWLYDGGVFEASGIFGQGIYVDPARNIVIAIHSAREHASREQDWALQNAVYAALAEAAGRLE